MTVHLSTSDDETPGRHFAQRAACATAGRLGSGKYGGVRRPASFEVTRQLFAVTCKRCRQSAAFARAVERCAP